MACLANVIRYASEKGLLVLLDGKRNDIGSTAAAYAAGFLGRDSVWGADALTVSPYLGDDSLSPFIDVANQRGAGLFILVKTSNPGGAMLQDLFCVNMQNANKENKENDGEERQIGQSGFTELDAHPLYLEVADYVQRMSAASRTSTGVTCRYGNIGAVVGATWPEQLSELRTKMPNSWLLVPGYGSQGGGARDCVGAFDEEGLGAIINNSRGIIFAHRSPRYAETFGEARWEEAVEAAVKEMAAALAAETSAGKLK